MTPVYTRVEAKLDNKNTEPLKDVEETTSVSFWLLFMRLRKSKGWLKPLHLPGSEPKEVNFQAQARPGLASSSHMRLLLVLLTAAHCSGQTQTHVRVPAPPSIKKTAALIMLFLYM